MSTLPYPAVSSIFRVTVRIPATVWTSSESQVAFVVRRTAAARHRMPLPDISAVEPSAL